MTETKCYCVVLNREEDESQREWFKRWMCQFHWMQTDYYQRKLEPERRQFQIESNRMTLGDKEE